MKKTLVAAVLLLSLAAWADRTDVWLASSVRVKTVTLYLQADAGCAVVATARVFKSDGGFEDKDSRMAQVAGANRTTCLDIIENKAPVLFKADQDL